LPPAKGWASNISVDSNKCVLRFYAILSAIEVYLVSDLRLVPAFFSSWKHRLHRSNLAKICASEANLFYAYGTRSRIHEKRKYLCSASRSTPTGGAADKAKEIVAPKLLTRLRIIPKATLRCLHQRMSKHIG